MHLLVEIYRDKFLKNSSLFAHFSHFYEMLSLKHGKYIEVDVNYLRL